MKSKMIIAAVVLASGCTKATDPMPAATTSTGRVTIERIGVVADSLAYGERRGIYVITDHQTGNEFIGVSGVGITETGSHPSGKTRVRDER
jgi:hypothetical protein